MVARHYGIRTERYKLIRLYQCDEWELYDLQKDPDERTNIYNEPENAKLVTKLKAELETLRKHYKDDTDISVMPKEWQAKFRPKS